MYRERDKKGEREGGRGEIGGKGGREERGGREGERKGGSTCTCTTILHVL